MNGTMKRDDDNIRVKGYLADTQLFTPPQAVRKHNILSISQWTEPLS